MSKDKIAKSGKKIIPNIRKYDGVRIVSSELLSFKVGWTPTSHKQACL